jgi:hypothetical protein
MRVQSRYVEYIGSKKVYAAPWNDYIGGNCPDGCLGVGLTLKEARAWKKKFEDSEKAAGCSNFEYRVAV